MGLPDLQRPAVATLRRGGIVLLLVVATLLAELVDLVGTGHAHVGPVLGGHAAAELTAGLVGVAVAAIAGRWIARRDGGPTGHDGGPRGGDAAGPGHGHGGTSRSRRAPSLGRRAVSATGALLLALVAHELVAVGLHAEHGAGLGDLAAHLAGTVLPLAVGLGLLVALVVGVRVVRQVVVAVRRTVAGRPLVVPAPAPRLLVVAADVVPAGLLPALRQAGRAPPVALR